MVACKRCGDDGIVKNGTVRNLQRYRCKGCGCNFVEGDRRTDDTLPLKKALSVILYSLGKASFGFLGTLFGRSRSLTYRWIQEEMAKLPEPEISDNIKEIAFDEMWHFLEKKLRNSGSSKRWIVALGEPLPGLRVVVMLQPSGGSTTRSNT